MDFNGVTQESLLQGFGIDVFDVSLDERRSQLHQHDSYESGPEALENYRPVFTDRGLHSNYKTQAVLKTCVYGIMDTKTKTPASLNIVDYALSHLGEKGSYTSVKTTFEFEPYAVDELGIETSLSCSTPPSSCWGRSWTGSSQTRMEIMSWVIWPKGRSWSSSAGSGDLHRCLNPRDLRKFSVC